MIRSPILIYFVTSNHCGLIQLSTISSCW